MTANPSRVSHPASPPQGDVELLERLTRARADLLAQVGRRIVGQHQVLDGILTAIFSGDRKSTRLNSSHGYISYAVFCLKKKRRYNRGSEDRRALQGQLLDR